MPKRGDPHGNGDSIVVRGRESRPHGEGSQVKGCPVAKVCGMQKAEALLNIYRERGAKGLPLERVYRHLFDPDLYLQAYGKIYRNEGAMTPGSTKETADGMCLQKIHSIIELLRLERYKWTPVRRVEISKANGKKRPLGIPTWSDKLLQEVLRKLLEPYYEQKFSPHSHGFRPKRGCHTALQEIWGNWKGTVWFIEGDIKGCFDNIDHSVLLEIIQRDIRDGRLLGLIRGLLKAGYMEKWKYHDTPGGTPQGGIISPLLANIYLNDFDMWVQDTLIPAYTRGKRRRTSKDYLAIRRQLEAARAESKLEEVKRLIKERRKLPSTEPVDPDYRRLRFVRYADDFILGFVGPKEEAERIREWVSLFLKERLKLTLSVEKTLITHAADEKAKFLGYELTVTRKGHLADKNGRRATNGVVALLMPQGVVRKYRNLYSKGGKIIHKAELIDDKDYTILERYQAVLRGLYNYYCMAVNVSRRMGQIQWILQRSLVKTLAAKHKSKSTAILRKFRAILNVLGKPHKVLQVTVERTNKEPLVATFGGIPFRRIPEGKVTADFDFDKAWFTPGSKRSEVVQRLLIGKCEICEAEPVEVHHIRKLSDIDQPGQRPKAVWEKIMMARRRKTLVVCRDRKSVV